MRLENFLEIDNSTLFSLERASDTKKRLAAWWIVLTQDASQLDRETRQLLDTAQQSRLTLKTCLDETPLTELLNAGQIGQPFNLPFYRDEDALSQLIETELTGPLQTKDQAYQPSLSERLAAQRINLAYPEALLYEKRLPPWANDLPETLVGIEAAANLYPNQNPEELLNKTLSIDPRRALTNQAS